MAQSIHEFHDDPRNAHIRIWVNDALEHRGEAVVSVFDSGRVLACGVSDEYTRIDRPFWQQAGVARKIELVLARKR